MLCYLAKNYPRVIPREELIDNVWAGNYYVGEKALTNAIWHLRQKLSGANDEDEVIDTIRKVGYRLLIEPHWLSPVETKKIIVNPVDNKQTKKQKIINRKSINQALPYLLLFIVAIIILWQNIFTQTEFKPANITQITKAPGSELFVAPSPNAELIVYRWANVNTSENLYITDRKQPQLPAQQLTFGNIDVNMSVWSNDGKYLYYARTDNENHSCEIIRIKVDSHQERKITDCAVDNGYSYIDISPDDKTLAFHGVDKITKTPGIYFISLLSPNSQPVRFSCEINCRYRDRDIAFSPDGKAIAITKRLNRFNENIFIVDLQNNIIEKVTEGEEDIVGLTWHPSGEQIIYAAQRADTRQGFIYELSSQKKYRLDIEGFSFPKFSKKSRELFFQQRTEQYHLANIDISTQIASSPFPVIQSDFNHAYPHYSTMTKRMVYVSNETGFYELWSADNNGKNRKQLTHLKQNTRFPRWSHDGERIAFLAPVEHKGGDKVNILDVATQQLSIVPSQYKAHNRPTWSFDDNAIISAIYTDEHTDLYHINITDGAAKRITFDGARYGIMTSASNLLYTKIENGLWQKDITAKNPSLKKISGELFTSRYSWTAENDGIYFKENNADHIQINFYSYKTQQSSTLIKLPLQTIKYSGVLTIIPEHKKLIFTQTHFPQANIKMLDHPLIDKN